MNLKQKKLLILYYSTGLIKAAMKPSCSQNPITDEILPVHILPDVSNRKRVNNLRIKLSGLGKAFACFLILMGFVEISEGQDISLKVAKPVFITGITYDSKTLEPLPNANFKVNNKDGFMTNESGRFSFYGAPGDTIVFTYMGYQPSKFMVPDTLKSEEYVIGVFMHEQAIKLAEIIILPRVPLTSIMIKSVKTDQKTMDIAQSHVNDAVVKGLTQPTKVYDAEMNAKKTMRTIQMRSEYNGMLVSPENSVGVSTQSYKTYNILYGSPITITHNTTKEMISTNESTILLEHYEAAKRSMHQPEEVADSTVVH